MAFEPSVYNGYYGALANMSEGIGVLGAGAGRYVEKKDAELKERKANLAMADILHEQGVLSDEQFGHLRNQDSKGIAGMIKGVITAETIKGERQRRAMVEDETQRRKRQDEGFNAWLREFGQPGQPGGGAAANQDPIGFQPVPPSASGPGWQDWSGMESQMPGTGMEGWDPLAFAGDPRAGVPDAGSFAPNMGGGRGPMQLAQSGGAARSGDPSGDLLERFWRASQARPEGLAHPQADNMLMSIGRIMQQRNYQQAQGGALAEARARALEQGLRLKADAQEDHHNNQVDRVNLARERLLNDQEKWKAQLEQKGKPKAMASEVAALYQAKAQVDFQVAYDKWDKKLEALKVAMKNAEPGWFANEELAKGKYALEQRRYEKWLEQEPKLQNFLPPGFNGSGDDGEPPARRDKSEPEAKPAPGDISSEDFKKSPFYRPKK